MSDELKIELQVETDDSKARSQLDNLISEYKNKKPVEIEVKLGNTNLNEFQANIKSITSSLDNLSKIDFGNLKTIETNLKNISKAADEYQKTLASTTGNKPNSGSGSTSILGVLPDFEGEAIERLSKNQKEALEQISSLKYYAKDIEKEYEEYRRLVKGSYSKLQEDNKEYFSEVNKFETMFDTKHFEKLVGYYKELDHVMKEYNSLGVNLTQMEKITNEKYDGTMGFRRWQQYVDSMGLSEKKFEELVDRAKDLTAKKNGLITNIKRNLQKASDDEKIALEFLNNLYKKMPEPDLTDANSFKDYLATYMKGLFEFDFNDLDLRFEEDFERMYKRFFKILDEVKDEYNHKFKDADGFEGFNIFDTDTLKKENEKLDKEIIETVNSVQKLKDLGSGTLKTLGLDDKSINVFNELAKSVTDLEGKLDALKTKFNNAFEISNGSSKSLERIKDALVEINKLSEEQKQTFFDFNLDTENIKKAKSEAEELKVATESVSNVNFNGLIESYSRLESASGNAIREIEKIRLSAMTTATLRFGFEEDDFGNISRQLETTEFSENISKRTKELLREYTSASKDLIKAQREYYEAVNSGKSSENTINKLYENVKVMESNLATIRNNVKDLEEYPDVMDKVVDSFEELDKIRHRQTETDALKIIDKADLAEANALLKDSKVLIDNISKDSIQLQKDLNTGYENASKGLEDRIKSQKQKLTNNLSKLMNISNSKAAIDQVFSYQLEKAQKTEIEIARLKDKANKTTGVKTVDEQDQYLKEYKRYLTELKAIQKSLTKESNETARAEKILQLDNTFKQLDSIKAKLNEVKSEVASGLFDQTMRELDLSLANNFSKTVKELDKVEEKISKLGKSAYANSDLVNSAESMITSLRGTLNKGFDNLDSKELSKILVKIEELKQKAKDIDLDIRLSKDSEKIETFIRGVTDRLEVLQSTANGVDISHITKQFRELTAGSDRNTTVMKSITNDLRNLEADLRSTGKAASHVGLNFRGFFDELGGSLRTFTLGDIIGDIITDALYQVGTVIKEMDAAMSNLKKVADDNDINSSEKLNNIRSQAIDVAKEVGMASSDVINAIADTLQAGVGNMQESIKVARSAMILANVGDMSQADASESLNTIINGFKLQPLKELNVEVNGVVQKTTELANAMDLLNYAGNNYAIGADGVAEAMKRGGTVLSQYGVTIEESVGLITAANEAIQDPAKVGNALKSMAINMGSVKANASKGTLELNKTAKALKEIAGIEVYSDKSKGEIKDMVTILDELNAKLEEGKLNQDEFNAISEALAGKEQAAVLQSLLGNYETFKQIREEFAQGLHFGSAEKENTAYVDSLNGKLNQLKEVWIDTLMVLADSDSVKGLLDVFISISEGINTFIKSLDSIHATFPALLGIVSGGTSAFKTFLSSLDGATESGTQLGTGLTRVQNLVKTGVVPALKNFVKQGLLIGGITAAVQLSAAAWDKLSSGVKNAAKELQTVEDEQTAAITAQNKKISILETTGVQYETLANKAKRTAEEEEEMVRLGNELAQILPEMVVGYDEENNAILHMTDDMEGLIEKTKEAKDQYERLLLGTRMEQSDNALKMLTDGEIFGKDALGLYDQKLKIQEEYNTKMQQLQGSYSAYLREASKEDGKTREKALEKMREIQNLMITEESNYQSQYLEVQSRILEQANIFRDEMDSVWRTSADLLLNDLTPALESGIESFISALDFSEISDQGELEAVRKMFRELPELAQSGVVDVAKLTTQIADINKEFANTGNLEDYNTNMKALAKSISAETGWNADVLLELFTQITDSTLESSTSLENFINAFGKTKQQLKDGDSVAQVLHEQFVAMEKAIESINNHDFDSVEANIKLRTNLQNDEDLPKQVRDMVTTLTEAGVEDEYIIAVTGQVMMSLKDGELNRHELDTIKSRLEAELRNSGLSKQEIDMTVEGILNSFNTDEMLKAIEDELGDQKVTKEITIEADNPDKINAIDEAIELLASRPDVDKAVRAVVEGEDDLVLFAEIIKNLPVNKDFTNKFIIENADALSKLNSYQEVLDYINSLPNEVKKTYGIKAEGLDETKEKVEKIDETIKSTNNNELKVKSSNDDVLQTIRDVETLIKISAEVEKGKYKIEIDANTQTAIDNINSLIGVVNNLNGELGKGKSVSYHANTEQAAKNISGLIARVNQIKKLTGKTFKYYANTAQAAKNIKGLIDRVNQIKKLSGKTFNYYANTEQAAKNISGLINRINQINGMKSSKSFSYTTTVKEQTVSEVDTSIAIPNTVSATVSPISAVANEIATQTSNMQANLRTGVGEINNFSSNMAMASRAINKNNVINMLDMDVNAFKTLEDMLKRITNELDLLGKKAESAFGEEKITYLEKQIKLLEEQQRIQKELSKDYAVQQNELKYYLGQKGFTFNSQGDVTNQSEKLFQMEKYVKQLEDKVNAQGDKKNEALSKQYENARNELEKTKKVLDEYTNNNSSGVNGAIKEWYELQQQINETRMEIIQATIDAKNFKFEIGAKKFEAEVEKLSNAINILDKQIEYAFGEEKDKLFKKKIELLKKQQKEVHNLANQYREQAKSIGEFLNKQGFIINSSDGSIGNIQHLESFKDSGIYEEITEQLEKYIELTQSKIPSLQEQWWELREAIDEARIATLEAKDEMSDLVLEINISKLDNALKKIKTEINRLEREIDKAFGSKKESLLSDKIDQLKQEQDKLHQMANEYRKQRQEIADFLNSKGFIIHPDGSIGNPEFILNFKKDPALMEYLQGLIDKHTSLGDKIADLGEDWWGVQGSIEDTKEAIEEARKELEKFLDEAKIDALLDRFNDLGHQLDLIDKKLKHATGRDKLDLISEKLKLIKEQQIELQKHWEFFNDKKNTLQGELGSLGFTFDDSGNITNYVTQLESLANTASNFEEIKEKLEEYFDIQDNRLPDIESDWLDLENVYKDTLKEQLNTTKEIEDKITAIYKKQIEDRIKAMEKETDAKLKALKKQQDAYNKYRDEVDYQNEYDEKLQEITDLQKQLDIAMKDTSLNGQKKVQQLQEQIAKAQKDLQKLTQDKIDQNINDMFDKESERIEEENEKSIEDLENQWSDAKIAEMVAQALGSGVFTDIEGNVHDLEDTLIDFAEETGELFGVLGTVIKSELITNLGIAKETVSGLAAIMKELDLSAYVSAQNARSIIGVTSTMATSGSYSSVNNQVAITAPIINIEGNVDSNVVDELKNISNKIKEQVIDAIANSIR